MAIEPATADAISPSPISAAKASAVTAAAAAESLLIILNASVTLSACTISGNQTGDGATGGGASGGGEAGQGGGITFGRSRGTLIASIVSNNRGRESNDILTFQNGEVTTGSDSYVGDLLGWSRTADPLTGGEMNLAPLGDYGGPTQTMIPLPGSPAIDPATSIARSIDQRGFPITDGSPDIGAVEFQGTPDILDNLFDLDSDGDGTSVGVELAIGTDPFVSDPENIANLRFVSFTEAGEPTFSFGLIEDQRDNIILSLARSTDLVDFTPIFMSTEDFEFPLQGVPIILFEDTAPPAGGKAFYRLEAVRRSTTP